MGYTKPTLSEQIEQMKVATEVYLGTTEARLQHSYLNVISVATAGAVNGIYGYADYIAKNVFPDTADTENLERWASIWGVQRTAAVYSEGDGVTFIGGEGYTIPIGTEIKRSDDIKYVTTEEGAIVSGTATVAIICKTAGLTGNSEVGLKMTLTSPPIGITSQATIAGTGVVGGKDEGTDDELRDDLYDRIQTPPHGGSYTDYETWTKEVDNVTRVWVYTNDTIPSAPIGEVNIRFMMDEKYEDGVPLQADIDVVKSYIESARPVTATGITVATPEMLDIDFTIALTPDTIEARSAVEEQLHDLFSREGDPSGTIYLSRISEAISLAVGEDHHYLTAPLADVTTSDYELPRVGTISWL